MRRTINKQDEPMSLQEVRRREEEAEQRIHAADGLVATAEARLEEVKRVTEATRLEYIKLDTGRATAEESLNKWEALSRQAEKDKKELEEQVRSKRDALTAIEVEAVTLELKMEEERKSHALSIKDELAKLNEAKEKARKEFQDICAVVEERKQKNASLVAAGAKLSSDIVSAQLEIESLEPKKTELFDLNLTILARKDAIVGISEEYALKVEAIAAEEAKLVEAKAATEQEAKRVQELHEALAIREAEVEAKLTSLKAVQENLETMRTRMQRAEQDAKAKEFLNKGY